MHGKKNGGKKHCFKSNSSFFHSSFCSSCSSFAPFLPCTPTPCCLTHEEASWHGEEQEEVAHEAAEDAADEEGTSDEEGTKEEGTHEEGADEAGTDEGCRRHR